MSGAQRHGWFKLAGQRGDREVADQMRGLEPALAAASGKTVLDLGCAEGAIALEFAKAGAAQILGLEIIDEHLEVARRICAGRPCEFQCADLNTAVVDALHDGFDVVLALAVIHKLKEPARVLRLYAGLARELIVIRMPAFSFGRPPTQFRSERYAQVGVDVARVLAGQFVLERVERGPTLERGQEPVLYFRRSAPRVP